MTETPSSRDAEAATVLVVEDERLLADMYADWLRDSYTVRTAYSGEEALSKLNDDIDVALVDRRLPSRSGDDLLEHIHEEGLDIRVAMVSAVTPDFDIIGMGFDDYLVKPVGADDIRETVDRLLQYSTYNEQIQHLEQLVATKTALESKRSQRELLKHDEYQQLEDRIETVRRDAADTISNLDDEPIDRLLRNITTSSSESDRQGGEDA